MKFLQAVVLSVISTGYATASYIGWQSLYRAIDEGNLKIAVDLAKQDEPLGEEGVRYAIAKDNPDFIANFVNQTNQANARTLVKLWRRSPIETVEKVLEKVDFPQRTLIDVASSYKVVYFPETFLVLLNKIVKPEDQEKVMEKVIEQLAHSSTGISPLLNALKGKTFRSERLEYLAIQTAFMEGVKSGIVDRLPEDICGHATITPELYADGLIVTAGDDYDDMRQLLLDQADRYDLETVKKKPGYADLDAEFRSAIEVALGKAAPGGTRTRTYDIQTVEKSEAVFDDLEHPGIPKDVFNIASDFLALDASTRKEPLAIQRAFMEGVNSGEVGLLPTEDICKHAAITPELYADALIVTAGDDYDDMRQLLLKKADRYDLETVKENARLCGSRL